MERTYVFDNGGNECGGGMMGLIASLCQNRGIDPNLLVGMMNNRNGFGFGGEGGWFMWVIFLFFLMGWGNGGFGGFGNRGGQGEGNFLAGQLANDTGRELLQQAINGNGQAISQLASTLNCDVNAIQGSLNQLNQAICNVGNQVGMTAQQTINAIQQGNCQIATQLSSCCCDLRDAITRQGYENQLANERQTNQLLSQLNFVNSSVERGFSSTSFETASQTCELKGEINALKQYVGDQFCALKERELVRENQSLRDRLAKCELSDSQAAQTAAIINQLQPVAKPAYITMSPYQSIYPYGAFPVGGSFPYGLPGYGYNGNGCCNNGCNSGCGGCGCN